MLFLVSILVSIQYLCIAQTTPQSGTQDRLSSVSLRQTPTKKVLESLAGLLKLDVEFDESVKESYITNDLKEVPARKVIEIFLESQKLDVRMKDDHTLFIFADTQENREKYKEMRLWSEKPLK